MIQTIRVHKFGQPEVMQDERVDLPVPGPDEVLVAIKASGVNPVDTYIRAGNYGVLPQLPYTPGRDGAGIIKAVGSGVRRWKEGDRVFLSGAITGTYAEEALCKQQHIHHLTSALSFEQGAAMGIPYATAYRALFHKAEVFPGELVLIHGASGGVGIAAIQLALVAGLRVFATAGTKEGEALVKSQGAEAVFSHADKSYEEQILRATNGRGVDIILEMLANENLDHDLGLIAKNGKIIVIGCRGLVSINPRVAMAREATIVGMMLANAAEDELVEIYAALEGLAEEGKVSPVIAARFPLAQAAQAHHAVLKSGAQGKIVLI